MRTISFSLSSQEKDAVDQQARLELRETANFVRVLVREALAARGVVLDAPSEVNDRTQNEPDLDGIDCLVPSCPTRRKSLGLCLKHYLKMRYYIDLEIVTKEWLIRNGKILPPPRQKREDFALPEGEEESLETLPKKPRRGLDSPDVRWLLGWPEAFAKREALERAQVAAQQPAAVPAVPAVQENK